MLTARFKHLDLSEGDWVLDLGCGEGRHVHGLHLLGTVNAVGADLDQNSLKIAEQGLAFLPRPESEPSLITSFQRVDALRLPYETDTFDAVICSEVLEHIGPYSEVLSEIRRILKPTGKLCVTVPRAWPERICWKLAPAPEGYPHQIGGHIRIFDAVDLKISVENQGFEHFKTHHAHALHSPYWWLKCLFWSRQDSHPLIRIYHKLLVWDIMKRPRLTRWLEAILNPIMGKSLVYYFGPRKST
ncbi:MAG: class I SAM-dependent methyltransferase [Pseudomonadota bacterium]